MSQLVHLVKRFAFSLRPGAPDPEAESRLLALLNDSQRSLYKNQSVPDRVHSLRNAAFVEASSLPEASDVVVVAAALHDVGKTDSRLPAPWRVAATVAGAVFGRDRLSTWAIRGGACGRLGTYVDHDSIGASMLEAADSHSLVVGWARVHHRLSGQDLTNELGVTSEIAELLVGADAA